MKRKKFNIIIFCFVIFSFSLFPKLISAKTNTIAYTYSQYYIEDKNIKDFLFEIDDSPKDTNNLFKQYPQMLEVLNNNSENIAYSYDMYSSNDEFVKNNLSELDINEIMPNADKYIEEFSRTNYKKTLIHKIYYNQFDIPQSIYYNEEGYSWYIPLSYIDLDKEHSGYVAVFVGTTVKNGPDKR